MFFWGRCEQGMLPPEILRFTARLFFYVTCDLPPTQQLTVPLFAPMIPFSISQREFLLPPYRFQHLGEYSLLFARACVNSTQSCQIFSLRYARLSSLRHLNSPLEECQNAFLQFMFICPVFQWVLIPAPRSNKQHVTSQWTFKPNPGFPPPF